MKDWQIWIISIIISVLLMMFLWTCIAKLINDTEARECASYIENNPDREFKIVGGECSVLYHDLWVEVEKFEYSLP